MFFVWYNMFGDNMTTLDIFYNEIIPEAKDGVIKNYFTYNVIFNTYLKEEDRLIQGEEKSNGVITPLLIINNKRLFDKLLEEYVNVAMEFYRDSMYLTNILSDSKLLKEEIDIRKNILAMLWSNATFEDFERPIDFLKRRIDFFNSEIECKKTNYGYIDLFNGELEIEITKDEIYNETPYQMLIRLIDEEGNIFDFPSIKFGISNNILYIYAIQNKEIPKNSFTKKVNRLLYKCNEGFDEQEDLPEIYGIGNLKDISVSFLMALNIAITYFKNIGIDKVVASSILLPRWNAKRIAIEKRYKDNAEYENLINEQLRIQNNLTEKFLRTFLRLKIHYKEIEALAYPFEIDSSLHLDISKMNISNNELLQITSDIINNKNRNL